MRYSWNAVFRDLTPMQLELCSDEVYDELIRTEEIKRMRHSLRKAPCRKWTAYM